MWIFTDNCPKINLVILSWNATSRDAFDRTTPVKPPIVNKAKNPNVNIKGVLYLKLPPYKVARGSAFYHFRYSMAYILSINMN